MDDVFGWRIRNRNAETEKPGGPGRKRKARKGGTITNVGGRRLIDAPHYSEALIDRTSTAREEGT